MADDGLHPGDLLAGRYRLIDRIGSGGMAVIWRAHDETLERLVAVKVLDLALSGDSRMRDLVRREAWAAARLNHPDVASVHDFVLVGDHIGVLVMQLVEGEPLADLIALGPLPWRETVRIGLRIAKVLALAHSRGVIHRDITPDNVIVEADRVTVLDFGIAARIGEPDEDSTGASFGTPAYVAPERLDGTPAHTATDVYALGVVLFEMMTGRVPFKVATWDQVAADHGPPPVPRQQGAPSRLSTLVVRMLAREATARPTAAEVVGALETPDRSRPLAAAAVGAAAVVAAAVIWWPEPPSRGPQTQGPPAVSVSPSAAASQPPEVVSEPTPAVTTTGPAPVRVSADQTKQALYNLLSQGQAEGSIRADAALDLRQVIQNLREPSEWEHVKAKISARQAEGAVSAAFADRLRSEVDALL
ncbi:MAG TPA: protein kinase [Candidatus Limnocylindrales bacterium]